MIRTKRELHEYWEAEGVNHRFPGLFSESARIQKFIRLYRLVEYYINKENQNMIFQLYRKSLQLRLQIISEKLGYTIPPNVFGKGLVIAHRGTIVINPYARIGENCTIHVCVNIGAATGTRYDAPQIGNNVFIGPGAKVFGKIVIADNISIGANAVVNKSFLEQGITIAGVPAVKVSGTSYSVEEARM